MNQSLPVESVRKICVLRTGGLGDLIVTLPAFHALRQTYPAAEIVLLGAPWQHAFFVKGRTPIDRVVTVPALEGIRSKATDERVDVETFFGEMQHEQFDMAISFQGRGIAANPFLKRIGARLSVGISSGGAEDPDRSVPYYYYHHEGLRCLEIVRLIGATTPDIEPRLHILPEDEAEISRLPFLSTGRPFVLLNPMATDDRRMWPLENYAPVVEAFCKCDVDCVVTGGPEDRDAVESLVSKMPCPVRNVCGISFGGLAALARRALLFVSPDTGPLHLAQAVECPSVGLYWAPNLVNWGSLGRRLHRPVISWKMECPLCGIIPNDPYPFEPMAACAHRVSFVRDITPEQVLKAAAELVGNGGLEPLIVRRSALMYQ